jgi:SHS2 domain-containing protein
MHADGAGHEAVEHTADLAVRAWAPDLAGLIEQAARGMFGLMLDSSPRAEDRIEVVGEGADAEELIVDCLREILALWTVEGRLPVSVEVREIRERTVSCSVGVANAGADAAVQEIKAVTYHDLNVRHTDTGLEVTVIFDV